MLYFQFIRKIWRRWHALTYYKHNNNTVVHVSLLIVTWFFSIKYWYLIYKVICVVLILEKLQSWIRRCKSVVKLFLNNFFKVFQINNTLICIQMYFTFFIIISINHFLVFANYNDGYTEHVYSPPVSQGKPF